MAKYLVFDIENEEPIKIASTLMQTDSVNTKSYISGASIRGAFISNYINIKKVDDINTGINKEKLLKGGIKFLNAYPVIEGNRALPMPKCFYALKDDIKKYRINNEMKITKLNTNSEEDYERVRGFEFADFDADKIKTKSIEKINNLHIRKDVKNKLFRYEAIKPNNKFRAIIKCEKDEYANEAVEILENGMFYIGGSKGTGYGKCKISNIVLRDKNPEFNYLKNRFDIDDSYFEDSSSLLCIYATSDIIYRNNLGEYKCYIDEDYLRDRLNLKKVFFKDSFIETEYFTSFNNKWRYRLPIVNGIKAGSVLIYNYEGNLDVNVVQAFMEEGIGERKQDGFGNFAVLTDICEDLPFTILQGIKKERENIHEVIISNDEDKSQLNIILNRMYINKLNKNIPKIVLKLCNETDMPITANQIGKLTDLMDILQGLKYEEGVKRLKDYFGHIDSKKINEDLADTLRRSYIEGKNIKNYLIEELSDNDINNFKNKYGHYISLGGVQSKLSDELQAMYEYKIKILKELFRLKLRKEA